MQIRILWVISVLLLISQLGYWLIDRGNTGTELRKNYSALGENKDKQNQLDNIIRRQDNKILYMQYKTDSLKIELSKHQITFDEYKRDTQRDIALLESDLKGETSRRKADDRKINKTITKENKKINKKINNNKQDILELNNSLEPVKATLDIIDAKVDRIKEKSLMNDDEYRKFKERANQD